MLDVRYQETRENKVDPFAGQVKHIDIVGCRNSMTLLNPQIDDATGQIVTHELWRGIGDASSTGTWDLMPRGYVLRHYEIDATYNGEIDPVTVLDLREEAD